MEVPSDFTAHFCAKVEPGKTTKLSIPLEVEVSITNISIGIADSYPDNGRVVLYMKNNDQNEIAIASFILGKFQNTETELHFAQSEIQFYTSGVAVPIQISGYICGGLSVPVTIV